jgi:diguanylate cyclase (GGDEF)-like protein
MKPTAQRETGSVLPIRPEDSEAAALRARVEMLESVIENFPGGLSLYDADLRLVLCNSRQREMLELPEELVSGEKTDLPALFRFNAERGEYGPGDPEEHVQRRMDLVRRREAHCYDRTRPNGMILEVRGLPVAGGGFVTTYLDVTEQRRNQATIAHMAHHDALTGLPNRLLFEDRLTNALAQVRRGGLMALHYVDLDRFKPVNDALGHAAGDELLALVARRLRDSVRESDTVARLGGDEFALIQTGIADPDDAGRLAGRLVGLLAAPFRFGSSAITIGASVGVVVGPRDARTVPDIKAAADRALYRSKDRGRGCWSTLDDAGPGA